MKALAGGLAVIVGGGLDLRRVIVRVPVLGLPVGPDEAPGLLEVRSLIDVLLAPLDFGFHAAAGMLPLAHVSRRLLISSLVRQLLVLVGEPDLLQLLLLQIRSRVVLEVVASALELVYCRELCLLVVIGVESAIGRLVSGALSLLERAGRVREAHARAADLGRSGGKRAVDTLTLCQRYVIDGAELGRHQPVVLLRLLHYGQLVVPPLHFIDCVRNFLAEALVLVALDSNG